LKDFRFLKNITGADPAVCEEADSFLQSADWGRFKSHFGWKANAFTVDWECGTGSLLVLVRRIAPGITMAYIPWGPEMPAAFPDDSFLRSQASAELACALKPLLSGPAFIRFDPPWYPKAAGDKPENFPPGLPAPFKRAAADIQPPDTVLIDLMLPAEQILAAMKPKWRYNINLASKHGVSINDAGEKGIDLFYRLLTETASRDGIAIHNIDYYRTLFSVINKNEKIPHSLKVYTAVHENEDLAAIMVLFRGKQATYLYGASSNYKRNLMAPYLLQWKAMQDAKAAGCLQYDLFGIPPNGDPHHPMAGLYRFKTGFGGQIVHRPGSWDYPCKPVLYTLFGAAESFRKKLRDSRKRNIRRI